MAEWIVAVQWIGSSGRIRSLLADLAHLEPRVVPGKPFVEVTVTAPSAADANAYVVKVLSLAGLAGVTIVQQRAKEAGS